MKFNAVIFDFDYTLGDATEAIYAGFCAAFAGMGLPQPPVEDVRKTVGMMVTDAYTHLTGNPDPANRDRFYQIFHPVARDLQAQGVVDLLPGARELLTALHDKGVPTAVVSSKNDDSLHAAFRSKGIEDLIALVIGGRSVSRPKPDPEGIQTALRTLGLAPEDILYCGDTVIDAQAARNAGANFCAVLNGTTPAEDFAGYPSVHISPDLADLQAWLTEGGTL